MKSVFRSMKPSTATPPLHACSINVTLGNTSSPQGDAGSWHWKVFVSEEPAAVAPIEEVTFHLHPTFSPSTHVVKAAPWEMTATGWGTFSVGVDIIIGGKRTRLDHHLVFGEGTVRTKHTLNLKLPTTATPIAEETGAVENLAASINPSSVVVQPVTRLDAPFNECHGTLGKAGWLAPRQVTECHAIARPGYADVAAHEYLDEPETLEEKIQTLANMIRKSKNMLVYSGAGISTASGIPDYATQAGRGSVVKKKNLRSNFDAQPTLAHRVLVSLYEAGYLKHWVQQNHDGLPQKAGFPVWALNEIHGAWHDPSNKVVQFNENLRSDLFEWLHEWENKTDFSLVVGTSLSGMNADRVAITPGERAVRGKAGVLGCCIINIQRTKHDDITALRIFANIDVVMARLAQILAVPDGWQTHREYTPLSVEPEALRQMVFTRLPYNAEGKLARKCSLTLDLRTGAKVRVTHGSTGGYCGTVVGRTEEGHIRLHMVEKNNGEVIRVLGLWWLEAAVRGAVPRLPVVNVE